MTNYYVSAKRIDKARQLFEKNEPRDLFYRVAAELVKRAIQGTTSLTLAESLAVLLQTWNKAHYQYVKFDSDHFSEIDRLLHQYRRDLGLLRRRSIESLLSEDRVPIVEMFERFESVLGPVGSAKALHLLAPMFFPIWDRAIAKNYGSSLQKAGSNGVRYWRFMEIAKKQCQGLRRSGRLGPSLLKQLDEYNYCRFTKRWL